MVLQLAARMQRLEREVDESMKRVAETRRMVVRAVERDVGRRLGHAEEEEGQAMREKGLGLGVMPVMIKVGSGVELDLSKAELRIKLL